MCVCRYFGSGFLFWLLLVPLERRKIILIQRLLVVAKNKTVKVITLWNMALEFNSTRILRNFLVIGRLRSSHILPFETEIRVPAKAAGQVTVFFLVFFGSFRINLICYFFLKIIIIIIICYL